jgi:AraC-like DNA-binding protein
MICANESLSYISGIVALEATSIRVLSWSPSSGVRSDTPPPSRATESTGVVSVLSALDELASLGSLDDILRRAVEVARECIGLERVGLYLRDPTGGGRIMRGTWGTDSQGRLTDERALYYECGGIDYEALRQVQSGGARWLLYEGAPHIAHEGGEWRVIGYGWLAVTALVVAGELIGILYNDTAISHAPVDEGKQVRTAVFCSLLANLVLLKRGGGRQGAGRDSERSPLVEQVLRSLHRDPLVSGQELANQLSVSPGHVARSFKSEIGISLVEYRNRLRIERFFRLVEEGGGNLFDAASEAGFGSYAQFHRVFRRMLGTTPREYLTGRKSMLPVAPMKYTNASGDAQPK